MRNNDFFYGKKSKGQVSWCCQMSLSDLAFSKVYNRAKFLGLFRKTTSPKLDFYLFFILTSKMLNSKSDRVGAINAFLFGSNPLHFGELLTK